jgi:hypothetical protein
MRAKGGYVFRVGESGREGENETGIVNKITVF